MLCDMPRRVDVGTCASHRKNVVRTYCTDSNVIAVKQAGTFSRHPLTWRGTERGVLDMWCHLCDAIALKTECMP